MKCQSVHAHTGENCTREDKHDGYCHGKMKRGKDGSLNRTHWYSKNGKFRSHHWYEKKYPRNMAKGEKK